MSNKAQNEKKKDAAYKRKDVKSLKPLQIKLGENNFTEACTPLAFISFNVTQLSSLMCWKVWIILSGFFLFAARYFKVIVKWIINLKE